MQENKELFEVRQYFDTYLEKKWVFDTREEAEKFYELMNNKRIEVIGNIYENSELLGEQ